MNNLTIEIVNDLPLLTVFVDDLSAVKNWWNNVKDASKIIETSNMLIYKYKERILKFEIYTDSYRQNSKEVFNTTNLQININTMEI